MKLPLPRSLSSPLVAAVLATSTVFSVSAAAQMTEAERIEMPGQIVVCFESGPAAVNLENQVASWGLQAVDNSLRVDSVRSMMRWQRRGESVHSNVVLLEFSGAGIDEVALRQQIASMPGVRWAAPNVGYTGEVKELDPNDPQYGSQYHHTLMQTNLAWDITLGDASIVMGITDDGVDTDHADLVENLFVNAGEIAGDGIDNDANGYVDDVNGYDFVFGNADPNPNNTGDDHGTHVAGIAGARTNNGIGVAGTAGAATILPLQFYAGGQAWTAVNITDAFVYGADNGAQIISTSYNMDGWAGDPVVTAAFDYIYDAGVLHFNSAGNGAALNPARQVFHQSFLVASTQAGDVVSSFSNYGTGVDLAAPGGNVLSTILNNNYGTKSGTSMAAPNAAGVAALIWSQNPTWTRDQVAAQITYTAENIDAINPSYAGLLGGGRVNPFRALTMTLPSPTVVSAEGLPSDGAVVVGDLTGFKLRFDQIMDPNMVNAPSAFTLVYAGADGVFGTMDDAPVAISWDEYLVAGNEISFTVSGSLSAAGDYRFSAVGSVLSNPFGTLLDGNGDGLGGDSFIRNFSACATNAVLVDNAESGADWSVVDISITDGGWSATPQVPVGGGVRNDPPTDFDGSGRCFLTDNVAGNSDVDGGPTRLISRAFDLSTATDPYLSYARWISSTGGQPMQVDISSDNGATWISAASHPSQGEWVVETVRVVDFVAPTAQTRLRFSVMDAGTITEAGIDFLRVLNIDCSDPGTVGTTYCQAAPNSTGLPSDIEGSGSSVVADNDFTLTTTGLPANSFGIYFFGDSQVFTPAQNGFRCVDGNLLRILPATQANPQGVATSAVDLTVPIVAANVIPGATLNFQLWHRDSVGAGSNYSNALSVTWQ
ncbi:Thermophilic serine proteinase precursor [Planctomycetes bacterium Poly30]|uniref:Thermophilic serine proteinase n=1 Tax=Saltatorellus ferox TaxID=2528018 RepID=A0A518EL71_9BACT|nr:Thermophilic serine proteinase precursor [Planctomycetes bacterium Poly30]